MKTAIVADDDRVADIKRSWITSNPTSQCIGRGAAISDTPRSRVTASSFSHLEGIAARLSCLRE